MHQSLTLTRMIFANIRFKPLATIFNVLLLAVGIAVIMMIAHLGQALDQRFAKDLKGIDLVVGGKGSPLQIILSSVFHIDVPTGNIPVHDAEALKANPLIKSTIPLALGDNYNGYRIVGTNRDYIAHYDGSLQQGAIFTKAMEAVLGSDVATKYKLHLGDHIVGAHGLVNSDDLHTDFPYTVVGILKPSGSVLDRLVLTPVESVWHVHEHPDADDPDEVTYKKDHPWDEITALLISYKSPMAAVQLPRLINKSTSLQAASPAFEVARLNKLMGTGRDILSAFGVLLIGFSGFGLFITFFNAVQDRAYDIALMRSLGATRSRIFALIMAEVLSLAIVGSILGVILGHVFLWIARGMVYASKHMALDAPAFFGATECYTVAAACGLAFIAGLIPALRAYHLNISKTLAGQP